MFRRRTKRSYLELASDTLYPRGGWGRAMRYLVHRVRRLPDPAPRISRGVAAGVFASFTPLFGAHFFAAAAAAWVLRANMVAALFSTAVGNPLTFPLIATSSVGVGSYILGQPAPSVGHIFEEIGRAGATIWRNTKALFTDATVDWSPMSGFWSDIFLPYLLGGAIVGTLAGVVAHYLSRPAIAAYQRARVARLKKRYEKKQAERVSLREGSQP